MSRLLSVISIFILTTLIAQPSYSDDVTINLDSTTPYVDIPVTVTEPVDATISTVTGTPQDNPGFIDSWIEVWQDTVRLAYNDDGLHSASNCCNSYPTGSYLLSTNLTVATPSPSPTLIEPTPEPSPSPTESQTSSPTPVPSSSTTTDEPTPEPSSPSPLPSDTPSPSLTPEVPVAPVQEPSVPSPEVLLESSTPEPSQSPYVQDTLEVVVDSSPSDFPSSLENELPLLEETLSIDETESLLEFLPELSLESLQETFQQISETITETLSTVSNLGSEFTPEEREQAQQVVLGAIIVTQLSAAATTRRIK